MSLLKKIDLTEIKPNKKSFIKKEDESEIITEVTCDETASEISETFVSDIDVDFINNSLEEETLPIESQISKCEECDYQTTFKSNLTRHMENRHSNDRDSKKFECEECDKKCNSKEALKYHTNAIHSGIRFPCEHCIYKATTQQGLKKHQVHKHTS